MAVGEERRFDGFFVFEAGVIRTNGDGEGLHIVRTWVTLCCRLWKLFFPASKQIPTLSRNLPQILCYCSSGFALLVLGCATPESRIQKDQVAFAAYPPATQEKIRAGHVEVGFTTAMVKLALGAPDDVFTRTTDRGTEELWTYRDRRPRVSFGLGIGGGGGSTSVGTGVGVSSGGGRGDRLRITFQGGVVTEIQERAR